MGNIRQQFKRFFPESQLFDNVLAVGYNYTIYEQIQEAKTLERKEISQAVISRLPRYFRYLGDLKDEGVERISSQELSQRMQVTASQIRQDLNNFGGFGQQGYGYNVDYLYVEIGKILGLDKEHHMILVGAGNLGQALVNYMNFERRGFIFKGIFDNNPLLHGRKIRDIEVRPMDEMSGFIRKHNIDIAVLTIPRHAAIDVAAQLVDCGIRAIWNFAHLDLNVPDSVQVENVHLSDSLMKLSYTISRYEKSKEQ
jgi:redox-sensing transcriptional repressor